MSITYDIGDAIVLRAMFSDPITSAPVDPMTVTLTVVAPSGTRTVTSMTVVSAGTGDFRALFEPAEPGQHLYRVESTGSVKSAAESSFNVRVRRVV